MAQKKRSGVTPLFIIITAILLLGLLFFGLNALNQTEKYEYQASLTATPSATPRSVAVTRDPELPTPSPAVTALLFQNGAKGEAVERIQARLKELGYYGGELDGQYGNGTKAAIMLFQSQHQLGQDGIVGEKTYELLFSDQAQRFIPTPTPDSVSTLAGALPLLVNRDNTLDESFYPANLVYLRDECPADLIKIKGSEIQGVKEAVDALKTMIAAAQAEGISPWQVSAGYRSVKYQRQLFDQSVQKFISQGSSKNAAISSTRLTVADPGASEHHTGLAFDITVPGKTFASTKQCTWLHKNCWDYGFIIRYQENKQKITGFIAEAWHIRYVGLPHSTYMRDNDLCLEEYLEAQKDK